MSSATKNCSTCTFSNSSSASRCSMCDTPFPVTGPDQWACGACTCRNAAASRKCHMCGTRRGGVGSALAGAVTGGIGEASWTCTKCTVTNTAGAARCECCDTARDSGVGNPSSAAAAASADDGGAIFNAERLSPAVWKIVEADRYGQFPFIYVIMGVDKCIVFDTGCDTGNLRGFIDHHINTTRLPYLVVCSHVHFDHIGGNHRFSGSEDSGCLGICMGGRKHAFTENFPLTSCCASHGCFVRPFTVTRWLSDGDVIHLDDADPENPAKKLQVLFTPGHTLDSISLFHFGERRLFVGDLLYPFTAVPLSAVGYSMKDYMNSLVRLQRFVKTASAAAESGPPALHSHATNALSEAAVTTATVDSVTETTEAKKIKLSKDGSTPTIPKAAASCDTVEHGDRSSSSATRKLGTDAKPTGAQAEEVEPEDMSVPPLLAAQISMEDSAKAITLSCGHVEANLDSAALQQVLKLCLQIRSGATKPVRVEDGDTGEYTEGRFSLLIPLDANWEK